MLTKFRILTNLIDTNLDNVETGNLVHQATSNQRADRLRGLQKACQRRHPAIDAARAHPNRKRSQER